MMGGGDVVGREVFVYANKREDCLSLNFGHAIAFFFFL